MIKRYSERDRSQVFCHVPLERMNRCLKRGAGCAKKSLEAISIAQPQISMSSPKKICHERGMPLIAGLANCSHCGATVGTLFSETSAPVGGARPTRFKGVKEPIDSYDRVEQAKER